MPYFTYFDHINVRGRLTTGATILFNCCYTFVINRISFLPRGKAVLRGLDEAGAVKVEELGGLIVVLPVLFAEPTGLGEPPIMRIRSVVQFRGGISENR